MADVGHQETEKLLKELEQRIAREYRTAVRDMQKKLRDYQEQTEAQRLVQKKLFSEGKITQKEYTDWCYRHMMVGKRWEQMLDVLTKDMHHANEIALKMAKEAMPDVYALNANYATYQIEHDGKIDTGFVLYNHDTAEYLLGDERQLMPGPSTRKAKEIAANKDMQWNKQKIQSSVLQGVVQGESPYDVAKRLMQVGQMNYNSAVRYARTMTTSAQNAGRYEAFRRADKLGVDLTIEWQATLDSRTRHEHRLMHGQRTTVDKPFHTPDGYTIMYPADCTGTSTAPQHEIWNCRCTLLSWVKGFEGETIKSSPKMGDMTFEEWRGEKETVFTAQESNVSIKGAVSDQNTNTRVFYDPKNDYSIHVAAYSDRVNSALSSEAKRLAELGTRDEVEWLSLIDLETGDRLHSEPGDLLQTGTDFWDVVANNPDRKMAFIHNHCLDGSLSAPDIEIALQAENIQCVIAVRNDGVKYVAPRNDTPPPYKFLFQLYGDKEENELVSLAIRDYMKGYYEHDGRT